MLAVQGPVGERLRLSMATGRAILNTEVYGTETMKAILSEKAVMVCELQSILYMTSLMCRSTKQFFHVSSKGMDKVPISMLIGEFSFV